MNSSPPGNRERTNVWNWPDQRAAFSLGLDTFPLQQSCPVAFSKEAFKDIPKVQNSKPAIRNVQNENAACMIFAHGQRIQLVCANRERDQMTGSRQIQTTVIETDDFGQLQDSAAEWDQRYSQLSPGRFQGRLEMVEVGPRQIFRESWGQKLRYQGTAPLGSFGLALPLHQLGTGNWVGNTTHPETVIIQAPGHEADMVSPTYWDTLVLSVPDDEVHSITRAISGDDAFGAGLHGTVTLKQEAADRLRRAGLDFLQRAASAAPQDAAGIEQYSRQFTKLFLFELMQDRETADFVDRPAKPAFIVSQATDMVLGDLTSTIGLTDVCTGLGISLRALHYAFQDVTGMSPATWLRTIRLNRVHDALLRASPEKTLVKQAAMEQGFHHLGHFSNQYQRLFGCLPGKTLRSG